MNSNKQTLIDKFKNSNGMIRYCFRKLPVKLNIKELPLLYDQSIDILLDSNSLNEIKSLFSDISIINDSRSIIGNLFALCKRKMNDIDIDFCIDMPLITVNNTNIILDYFCIITEKCDREFQIINNSGTNIYRKSNSITGFDPVEESKKFNQTINFSNGKRGGKLIIFVIMKYGFNYSTKGYTKEDLQFILFQMNIHVIWLNSLVTKMLADLGSIRKEFDDNGNEIKPSVQEQNERNKSYNFLFKYFYSALDSMKKCNENGYVVIGNYFSQHEIIEDSQFIIEFKKVYEKNRSLLFNNRMITLDRKSKQFLKDPLFSKCIVEKTENNKFRFTLPPDINSSSNNSNSSKIPYAQENEKYNEANGTIKFPGRKVFLKTND